MNTSKIISDNGEEDNVFYHHANDNLLSFAADEEKKSLKHLDHFLIGYCAQIGVDVVKGCDIPYKGIPIQRCNKDAFKFWDESVGM